MGSRTRAWASLVMATSELPAATTEPSAVFRIRLSESALMPGWFRPGVVFSVVLPGGVPAVSARGRVVASRSSRGSAATKRSKAFENSPIAVVAPRCRAVLALAV